jgi:DNA-binding SARP family transcriptional activator
MRFGVLGALRVLDDQGIENAVPAAKHRVLLAALLLNANQQVPREALVDVLWDQNPPPNAASALRTYLTRLRGVLGDASDRITSTPSGISIALRSAAEFDVAEAEQLHQSASAAARDGRRAEAAAILRRAEALWRGRPLADIPSDALRRRELPRLEELRLAVTEQRIDVELALGRTGDLVGELRALVAAHPLRERGYAQLMLALYRAQRRGEALDVYREAREVLREQLGADPTAQLRELHQRILADLPVPDRDRAEPAPSAPSPGPEAALLHPRQLPVAPRGFAGRARELKQLDELATDLGVGTVVICAVNGTAGVGKTTLALHWAHRSTALFPDGQLYVNLRGFDPGEQPAAPEAVLRDFLAALGVSGDRIPAGLEPRSALYRGLLAGRRVLVVLDNARDARQVRPLLPAEPGCLTVVTSRTELRGLVVAEGARTLPLSLMDLDEAGELLARKLGSERIHEDVAATRTLIDLCARLPLALSIAAAHIDSRRHATVRSFAEDLRAASTSLDLLGVDDPLTDLRTVMSCSIRALNPDAALTFRLLGFVPGRDVPAEAVCALTGLGAERTQRALDELVDASLLTEAVAGRYSCHDLLCEYARELTGKLEPGVADEASRRLLGWYVHAAAAADRALDYRDRRYLPSTGPEPARVPAFTGHDQADAWFAAEHANIAAAATMAAERALDPAAWDLAMLMWNYYYRNRLFDEWLHVLLTGLGAARERGTPRDVQAMLHMLGLCYRNRQELPEAIDAYEQAVALARTLPDLHLNVALNNLAMAYLYSNRGADAIRCLDEALAIVEAFGDETATTALLNNIGDAHRYLGQFEQALPYLERGLALALELGDSMAAYLLATLGEVHIGLANFREAAEYCRRSVDLLRGLKHPSLMVKVLDFEGSALRADGDRAGARGSWTEALALCEQFELPEAVVIRAHLAELDRPG